MPTITISNETGVGVGTRVVVGGHDISRWVRGVSLSIEAGGVVDAEVRLVLGSFAVDLPADVVALVHEPEEELP